jgi:hypothetical protein
MIWNRMGEKRFFQIRQKIVSDPHPSNHYLAFYLFITLYLCPLSCLERDKMRQATMKLDRRVKRLMLRDRKYEEALEVGRQWVAITRGLDVLLVAYYTYQYA